MADGRWQKIFGNLNDLDKLQYREAAALADMAVRAPVQGEHPLAVLRDGPGKSNTAEVVDGKEIAELKAGSSWFKTFWFD